MPLTVTPSTETPAPAAAREQAWALKQACYAAWSSDPQQALQAAEALARLAAAQPDTAAGQGTEIGALADWTAGIAHLTQGRLDAACQALDRAADAFRQIGMPLHAAETQVPKIMGLTLLGRHDDAARCGEEAEREFIVQGHTLAAAKVSLNLGSLQLRRDAQAEAARHYRAAALRFARVGDHEHSVMADIGLADALTAQGQLDEARRILGRAGARAQAHALPVLQAIADESAALLALVRGHYRDALAGFERSRRAYEQLGMPQHVAVAEKQLADAYLELRLLPEALALYGPAVRRFAELEMPTEQAWTLAQQGRALVLSARVPQAVAALEEAGRLFEAQGVHSGLAAVALARAELASTVPEGAGSMVALALADAACRDFDRAHLAEGRLRAQALRGRALLAQGRLGEASAAFGDVQARAEALHLLTLQVMALSGQAEVAEREGRDADAARDFERAMVLTEAQRRALPGDEIRSAFLADHLGAYQGLLRLALRADSAGDAAAPARVLQRLDAFRARALADRLQQGAAGAADPDDDSLRGRLNWLYRREQRARADGDDLDLEALSARIRDVERELLERSRRRRLAAAAVDGGAEAGLDVNALCASLGDDGALVAYGVSGDELFACVATAGGVKLRRRLALWPEAQQALRSLRFQLDTLRVGAGTVAAHLPLLTHRAGVRLQQVHALLWAPLVDLLQGCRRVLVVPQGPLAGVPFAALHDGRLSLGDRHQLAVAPSVQVALRGLRQAARPTRRVLAFGSAPHLPHVATEAARVAARFPDGRAYTGDAASLDALKAQASSADLLHLACHAQFRGDNPMFSALHLADGPLTAEAVEQLRLAPCTVVLSACDTALSGPDAGEDRVGLVRAFFVAGAARVLASLWPVDDAVTEAFMQHLHAGLAAGQAPGAALQAAQQALRRERPHPCHWAAFALHGGW